MIDWLILTATLPTAPSALRVRIWRALKGVGCASLREGVYILPAAAPSAPVFQDLEKSIQEAGAEAHMLVLQARDAVQEAVFKALFDRTEQYLELALALKEARALRKNGSELELRKALRVVEQQFSALQVLDFFPGKGQQQAAAGLAALRLDIERHLSPGEPSAAEDTIQRQPVTAFRGKTWATRRRPWVDRLATAWLVTRFVDGSARFIWIATPGKCPRSAIGFDFDGATFSHVADKVTFEVLMATFDLERDLALKRVGELVHYVDVGGIPVDEAAGVEALIRGLQAQHADDDALLAAALSLFDTLYAAMRTSP